MKEKNKIELTEIAVILKQIHSTTNYNGEKGLVLLEAKAINDLGYAIQVIVEDELKAKK